MDREQGEKRIREAFAAVGFSLLPKQCRQFFDYYEFLVEYNEKVNLTAITDFEEVLRKHFIDSAMLFAPEIQEKLPEAFLEKMKAVKGETADALSKEAITGSVLQAADETGLRMIDVGTGAGFPGIPLKILFPGINLWLLDSLQKRIDFLEALTKKLQLAGVTCLHGRAEDAGRGVLREAFDLSVSRAVANLSTLSEYCLPLAAPGGFFVSYKGNAAAEADAAKKAIHTLGGQLRGIAAFSLPGAEEEQRSLVVIEKVQKTPKTYPRKAGVPQKEPLR